MTIDAGSPLYRVHRTVNGPAYFDSGPDGRFNPPAGCGTFGTCYLATEPIGAYLETVGRRRLIEQTDIDTRSLTTVTFNRPLRLLDLLDGRNRGHFPGFDLTGQISANPKYDISQQVARLAFEEGHDGLWYKVSHDSSLTLNGVALFGEPGAHDSSDAFETCKTADIPDDLVLQGADEHCVVVAPYGP